MATEIEILGALDRELRRGRRRVQRDDAYYEGEQPLRYMAPALEMEVGQRIAQLVINWPQLCADAYADRLDIDGFRYPGADSADEDLWSWWEENDGEQQSHLAHLEALIHGRSYAIVGAGEGDNDPAIFTVEHPLYTITKPDPRTRKAAVGLKRWIGDDEEQRASLYLPNATVQFVFRTGKGWTEDSRDDHELGVVPVVQLTNRGRLLRTDGRSEFHSVIPIADAANKMATDMMISGEFHAMPRRWAIGMTEDDFADEDGKPIGTWSAIAGRLWTTDRSPDEVKVGQFEESDLAVFHNTIKTLSQIAAQLMFLPQDYMSFTSDNPVSADAMRSAESRMIKRVERKHTPLGGGWEDVHRLRLRFEGRPVDSNALRLKTIWRDPSTPTIAQKADAAVKLYAGKIVPLEQTREDLGYTPEQRRRMAEQDAIEADRNLLGTLSDQIRVDPPAPDAGA